MEHATKQFRKRNAILSCLRSTTAHPSAEMVHEMLLNTVHVIEVNREV